MVASIVLGVSRRSSFVAFSDYLVECWPECFVGQVGSVLSGSIDAGARGTLSFLPMGSRPGAEYSQWEDDQVPAVFREVCMTLEYYLIGFTSAVLLREVFLGVYGQRPELLCGAWVDTDYGWVLSAGEFLERLRGPEWDWRHELSVAIV